MATRKKQEQGISKSDIADFRKLVDMHREYQKVISRLSKKLECDFYELSEWGERLGKTASTTDDAVAFAMGRLSTTDY
jgi:hypothetical protein